MTLLRMSVMVIRASAASPSAASLEADVRFKAHDEDTWRVEHLIGATATKEFIRGWIRAVAIESSPPTPERSTAEERWLDDGGRTLGSGSSGPGVNGAASPHRPHRR